MLTTLKPKALTSLLSSTSINSTSWFKWLLEYTSNGHLTLDPSQTEFFFIFFLTKSTSVPHLPRSAYGTSSSSQKPSDHSWHFFPAHLPTPYSSPSHVNSTLKYKYHIIPVLGLFVLRVPLYLLSSLFCTIGDLTLKIMFPGSHARWLLAVLHKWRALIG